MVPRSVLEARGRFLARTRWGDEHEMIGEVIDTSPGRIIHVQATTYRLPNEQRTSTERRLRRDLGRMYADRLAPLEGRATDA